MIYLDNAATTALSPAAIESMTQAMTVFGNPSSTHSHGREAKKLLRQAREDIAKVLRTQGKNILFTSGATESNNTAIKGYALRYQNQGKHIITTAIEHHAVLEPVEYLVEHFGFEATIIQPVDGQIRTEDIKNALRPDTILVSVMAVNNETGYILPIQEIGQLLKDHPASFHVDAVQAVGKLPIYPEEWGINFLSASAHKFHGPKGVGVLYARNGIRLINVIEGGAQERGKRAGTINVPGIAALAAALEDGIEHMEENAKKTIALRDRLIKGLSDIPYSQLNGDPVKRLPGNVNYSFEGVEGESLLLALDMYGIECSSGSACTSESLDPSHVLIGMGVPIEAAHGSLRFSLNEENTEEQVDYIIEKVHQVVEHYRKISPFWDELEKGEREHVI